MICVMQLLRPALVQLMACRMFCAKPLSEPILAYYQLYKFQSDFNQNTTQLIQQNAYEIVVCQMAAILTRP